MPNFIPHDFNQDRLISISYEKQLPPGSFENTLWHIVHECLDFSEFNKRYKNDHGGRAAYNPAILFSVVIFGYYKGINTSRRIADACRENVIFKALSKLPPPAEHYIKKAHKGGLGQNQPKREW